LLPVGSLLGHEQVDLIDGYCIGADGKVDSVFLFSNQPIDTIDTVYLDSHSRTSNGLARILMHKYWNRDAAFIHQADYLPLIDGNRAGVVIGDKAVPLRDRFRYVYDLAHEWKSWSGLPFAFAVWAYKSQQVSQAEIQSLKAAFNWGLQHISNSANRWAATFDLTNEKALWYMQHCIDYRFDERKQEAVRLYLKLLAEIMAQSPPTLQIA